MAKSKKNLHGPIFLDYIANNTSDTGYDNDYIKEAKTEGHIRWNYILVLVCFAPKCYLLIRYKCYNQIFKETKHLTGYLSYLFTTWTVVNGCIEKKASWRKGLNRFGLRTFYFKLIRSSLTNFCENIFGLRAFCIKEARLTKRFSLMKNIFYIVKTVYPNKTLTKRINWMNASSSNQSNQI